MQQTKPIPPDENTAGDTVAVPLQEVTCVPLWVKGIIIAAVLLFSIQTLGFMDLLSGAIQKNRAENAYNAKQMAQAIDLYKDLHERFPTDKNIIEHLGFSYYYTGQYKDAIGMFDLLVDAKLPRRRTNAINAAMSDMEAKLNSGTR